MLILKEALADFYALSGLSSKFEKSSIFVARDDSAFSTAIHGLFGFLIGTLPVRYLGVPLITTQLRAADCSSLIEKITSHIKSWTSKFLSFAGRLQLIQSVLLSIQIHWASIFSLPNRVIDQVKHLL